VLFTEDLFFWYKDAKEVDPLGQCHLRDVEIENNVKVGNRDCFVIRDSEGDKFTGSLTSETNRESWVQSLSDANAKEPTEPPSRTLEKKKKKKCCYSC